MIEAALIALLSAHAGVISQLAGRIYPDVSPSGTEYPLATFFRVDQSPYSGLYQDSVWSRARVQFTVYAPTRLAARSAAVEIRRALSRVHQTVAANNILIDDSRIVQERDSFAADPHPVGYSAVELDFEIVFKEL